MYGGVLRPTSPADASGVLDAPIPVDGAVASGGAVCMMAAGVPAVVTAATRESASKSTAAS